MAQYGAWCVLSLLISRQVVVIQSVDRSAVCPQVEIDKIEGR